MGSGKGTSKRVNKVLPKRKDNQEVLEDLSKEILENGIDKEKILKLITSSKLGTKVNAKFLKNYSYATEYAITINPQLEDSVIEITEEARKNGYSWITNKNARVFCSALGKEGVSKLVQNLVDDKEDLREVLNTMAVDDWGSTNMRQTIIVQEIIIGEIKKINKYNNKAKNDNELKDFVENTDINF